MFNIRKDGGSEYSEPIPFRTEKYLPVPNIRKDGGSEYSEGGSSLKSWCTRIMRAGCPVLLARKAILAHFGTRQHFA